jgi:hypothetical protein
MENKELKALVKLTVQETLREDDITRLLKEDIRRVIKETVLETMLVLGIDASHPIEFQNDMRTLREWRLSSKVVRRGLIMGVIVTILSGAMAAVWIGFKSLISK